MAVIAGVTAGNMVGRLAGRRRAIVAAAATAQYGGVINPGHTGEVAGVMAIHACIQGPHVVGGVTRCRSAVMAAGTAARHTGMVKNSAGE